MKNTYLSIFVGLLIVGFFITLSFDEVFYGPINDFGIHVFGEGIPSAFFNVLLMASVFFIITKIIYKKRELIKSVLSLWVIIITVIIGITAFSILLTEKDARQDERIHTETISRFNNCNKEIGSQNIKDCIDKMYWYQLGKEKWIRIDNYYRDETCSILEDKLARDYCFLRSKETSI